MYYDSSKGDRYGRDTEDFSKDISEILINKIKTNEINELFLLKNLLE